MEQSFKYDDLKVHLAAPHQLKSKPDVNDLGVGKYFTDHMLKICYDESLGGWQAPEITPFANLVLHPAAKVFHYAVELFEGFKAYRGIDGKIRLFRPGMNMTRMNKTAERSGLPTFDGAELIKCLKKFISIDQEWIPHSANTSLYIRPTLIGTDPSLGVAIPKSALLYIILSPVATYVSTRGVSLLANPNYTRAWPGGCGDKKMGSNYAPTIRVQKEASEKDLDLVLWLYGEDHQLTEAGIMNVFIFFINDQGEKELVTPPLNGLILPGIGRDSVLSLAREWSRFKVTERIVTMKEISTLLLQDRLLEIFGVGTAWFIAPFAYIHYMDQPIHLPTMKQVNPIFKDFYNRLVDIQYGHVHHPWAEIIN